jgi:hypothetical protein
MPRKHKGQPAQPQLRKPRIHYISAGLTIESNVPSSSALQFDQHGREVRGDSTISSNVVLRPWKRARRELFAAIAKHVFPPDGKPRGHLTHGQIKMLVCAWAQNLGHEADPKKDGSTILRALGLKP